MTSVLIFGAGGNLGRAVVAEAVQGGHQVTAVVRDPSQHAALAGQGVQVVAGDITDADAVVRLAASHDGIISTAVQYTPGSDSDAFFTASIRGLLRAARETSARRIVVAGTMAILPDGSGTRLADAPIFPKETIPFIDSHALGLNILRNEGADVDWLYASPSGNFVAGKRTGQYRVAPHGSWTDHITYADLAVALVDEVENPAHHRIHLAVAN